jgi:hypothetical protein
VNADQTENLVGVLFDEGDDLSTGSGKGFEKPESELALGLVQTLLRQRISSKEERGTALKHSLESTSGLYLPARTVQEAVRENKRRKEYREPLYEEDDLDEIVSLLGKKIGDAASNGNLIEQPHLRGIFHIWYRQGFEDEALQWVKKKCKESTDSFFQCLEAFNAASESFRELHHQPERAGGPFSLDGERLNNLGLLDIFKHVDRQAQSNYDDLSEREHRILSELRRVVEAFEGDIG